MPHPEPRGGKTPGKNPGGKGRDEMRAKNEPANPQPPPKNAAEETAAHLRLRLEEATAEEIRRAIQVVLEELSDQNPTRDAADTKEGD